MDAIRRAFAAVAGVTVKHGAWFGFAAISLALACASEPREPAGPNPLLASTPLEGVLGADGAVSVDSLRKARGSGLRFIEYIGYMEALPNGGVTYFYRGSDIGSDKVVRNARPYVVSLTRVIQTDSAALSEWRLTVERVRRAHGEPSTCQLISGENPGRAARWQTEPLGLEIAVHYATDSGEKGDRSRLITKASRESIFPAIGSPCKEVIEAPLTR